MKEYVSSLIMITLIMTIIELLLANYKHKKYVMFVGTLVLLLSVIQPVVKVLGREEDVSQMFKQYQQEMQEWEIDSATKYSAEAILYQTYVKNLETDMKQRLEDIGYQVIESEIQVDENTYQPSKIVMRVRYEDGFVQPIVIDVFGTQKQENWYEADTVKIKESLKNWYGIEKEQILVNEK